MKKNALFPLKLVAALAMLCAISIICGKYLAFGIGNVMRFSFENLPIIFAGLAFGPVAGVLVGVVADLVGCVMVGYTVNPVVTLGAAVIGAVSGFSGLLLRHFKFKNWATVFISVTLAHLIGSVVIKTFGLAAYYDLPLWALMLWRLLNYVIVGAVEGTLLVILFKNREVARLVSEFKPQSRGKAEK